MLSDIRKNERQLFDREIFARIVILWCGFRTVCQGCDDSEIVDVGDFDKKKVLDSIQVALCGIDAKKEKVNLVSSRDRDKDFFGPIYVMKASTITLESECEVWNIELPFQISDNEAELIEVKLWNDENNENILLIKRLSSKKIYDFAL